MKPLPPHNGLLLMDKPKTWTSHDLVSFVRKSLGMKEVGHCGTLDPLASGLMVLLLGEGTKVSSYILERDKTYETVIRLGIETDSFDMDGQIVSEKPVNVSAEDVARAVESLQGPLSLAVPIYSAVKVKGEKLYEKARRGDEDVQIPVKVMEFKSVELLFCELPLLKVRLHCSKGSFIRSWVQELGRVLGTGATVQELRRLRSEPYSVEHAISVDVLRAQAGEREVLENAFIGMNDVLPEWRSVRAERFDAHLLVNGTISHQLKSRLMAQYRIDQDLGMKVVNSEGGLLALIGLEKGKGFVIRRVFRH